MNAESQPVEQIDCDLGIPNGLCAAASAASNIVDASHTSDLPLAEISNCRQQELCCDARSWTETKWLCRTFVTDSVEPKSELQAVLLCDQQMHLKVRHVDFPLVIPVAKLKLNGVQAFHLEVLVLETRIDRCQIDAPLILSGGPHPSVGLIVQKTDGTDVWDNCRECLDRFDARWALPA